MLSPEDKEKCEGLFTNEEYLQDLKDTSLNKKLGSHGLPVEFYKVFWSDIIRLAFSRADSLAKM